MQAMALLKNEHTYDTNIYVLNKNNFDLDIILNRNQDVFGNSYNLQKIQGDYMLYVEA